MVDAVEHQRKLVVRRKAERFCASDERRAADARPQLVRLQLHLRPAAHARRTCIDRELAAVSLRSSGRLWGRSGRGRSAVAVSIRFRSSRRRLLHLRDGIILCHARAQHVGLQVYPSPDRWRSHLLVQRERADAVQPRPSHPPRDGHGPRIGRVPSKLRRHVRVVVRCRSRL